MSRPHVCPGCATAWVAQRLLACSDCWTRLPQDLRDAITQAWRALQRNRTDVTAAVVHRRAVGAALIWYRRNPARGTT